MNDEGILGLEGEECRSCGTTLAVDQRYCLNCGQRRGETRVDLDAMAGAAQPDPGPTAPPLESAPAQQGAWTPMAIVGGIATLAVVLLVGVMLGRGDNSQNPVPIAAAPAATTAEATTTADASGQKVADAGGSAKDSKGEKSSGGKDKVKDATSAPGAETVTDDQLNALDNASGDDYAKQSKNLPDTIALPGDPPPKDNQEPGGGSDAQVIK
jgi:hypothetical protein